MKSRCVFALILLILAVGAANANVLTLNALAANEQYQQTVNSPCIIGNSCQNGGLPYTSLPGGANSYNVDSPVYTVGQLTAIVGDAFYVGLDINQDSTAQTLSLFTMSLNGVVTDTYSASPATSVPPTPGGGNGNGYADYLFKNFTSLSGLAAGTTVQFHATMPLVNDGFEQFFLVSAGNGTIQETPEPVSFILTGAGLLAVAAVTRRRTRRS
jgi:hypothetical protein